MWQTCYHPTKQVDMHNGLGTWCPAFVCVCVCLVVCLGGGGGVGKVALGSFYMFFPVFYVMHFTYNHTIHTCMYQYGSRNERSPLSRFTR